MRKTVYTFIAIALLSTMSFAQFAASGTTTLSVNIPAEAAIQITTGTTTLSNSGGTTFAVPFTGTTNFTYKVRTTASGGSGAITAQVTTDFSGTGAPSVATYNNLSYSCTAGAVGSGCSSGTAASTTAATSVISFGANAKSANAGDSGSVAWSLADNPQYSTGTFTATVTFTISAA